MLVLRWPKPSFPYCEQFGGALHNCYVRSDDRITFFVSKRPYPYPISNAGSADVSNVEKSWCIRRKRIQNFDEAWGNVLVRANLQAAKPVSNATACSASSLVILNHSATAATSPRSALKRFRTALVATRFLLTVGRPNACKGLIATLG